MIIEKKRIQSVSKYLNHAEQGQELIFGVKIDNPDVTQKLREMGFSNELEPGEKILPPPIGRVSIFNAEGKFKKHTDQPKEIAYRQAEWTWEQFNGPYDTITRSKIVDVPYKRYPRTFVEPPSEEIEIQTNASGDSYVVARPVTYEPNTENQILHIINLMLELFGCCEVLQTNLVSFATPQIKRLNWNILPPGEMPWQKLRQHLQKVIEKKPASNQKVLQKRHEAIAGFDPEFVAIGQGGFSGYVVFGFPDKGLFILESSEVNNATYVIEEGWEEISQLTKSEILANDLHKDRIIHRENWFERIGKTLDNHN